MLRVAAVDLGATSARVAVVDLDAADPKPEVVHRHPHQPVRDIEGSLRWDWSCLVAEVERGLDIALSAGPLASIGIDTWGVDYGLGGGLWTRDLSRAHRIARELRAGMVWVNAYKRVNPGSPFGGVGSSGYGREMGFEAMREYTEAKSVWINVDAALPPFYPRG